MRVDDELRRIFAEEATEFIETLLDYAEQLSVAEERYFDKTLEQTLRLLHNLKGAATSAGVSVVEVMAHALEAVLGKTKETSGPLPKETSAVTVDALGVMQAVVDGELPEAHIQEMYQRLTALGAEIAPQRKRAGGSSAAEERSSVSADPTGTGVLADAAIRVDTKRLDHLMSFVGEFLSFQTRMTDRHERQTEIFKQLQALNANGGAAEGDLSSILAQFRRLVLAGRKDLLDFSNLSEEVNETAKQLRTVPLRGAARIWRRVVREAAAACDKEVSLEISLGRVEIDRYVLERLHDPMMHLLRNAVDHGIESSEERVQSGKSKNGLIRITASTQGAMVSMEVSDDGRGIDWDKVKKRAVANQLITSEQAMRVSVGQTTDLLFRPGFSTADRVGRISGRGVGLDVVRSQVEALGGHVEVTSEPALGGTTILLTVPISVLSSTGMFVRSGDVVYALPIESVERIVRVRSDALKTVEGRTVVELWDADPVRTVDLAEVMGNRRNRHPDQLTLVVLARGRALIGLVVDEVIGQQEYVTHGLPWNFKGFPDIAGAILSADGAVALLIDVVYLFAESHLRLGSPQSFGAAFSKRVLVVDDSLSSRTLQRAMLKADGYDVTLAADGQEAWNLLNEESYDLVVSDVQMPHMSGIELTKRIRAASALADLPVILVTNLAKDEDREVGAAAGADDYLVKGSFDQQGLLSMVQKYLGGR